MHRATPSRRALRALRSARDAPRPRSPRSPRGVVIAFRALRATACARFGLAPACNLAVIS